MRFSVGQEQRIFVEVKPEDIERFVTISGDAAPLHTDAAFAQRYGFEGSVVHGALLTAYVSRLVSDFPGRYAILERIDIGFRNPCYAPCELQLTAKVRQISEAVSSLVMDLVVAKRDSDFVFASGRSWHKILPE